MANFKTHVKVGAGFGFAVSILTYLTEWVQDFRMVVIIYFTTVIGSFLPDMDSATGIPIQIIFGLYSYFAAGAAFYFLYNNYDIYMAILGSSVAFVLVWYFLRPYFKKKTTHRGIFHSTPAIVISFLATLTIVGYFKIEVMEKFSLAMSVGIGYASHLFLDEIYSTGLNNGKIKVKKSLGTALDLGFKNKKTAFIAYSLIVLLTYLSFPLIKEIYFALT